METLKRQVDFSLLKKHGRRIKPQEWLIINYSKNNFDHLRFGFTASRRVEKSVYRNRLKRWSREFFRDKVGTGIDINLVFRKTKNETFFRELKHDEYRKCLEQTWQTIRQRLS